MRRIVYFSLGFGAVCLACASFCIGKNTLLPGAILLLLSITLTVYGMHMERPWLQLFGSVLFGASAGFLWFSLFQSFYLAPARDLDGITETVSIRVCEYSWEGKYGFVSDGQIQVEGIPYRVRVYLDDQTQVVPGDELTGNFSFRFTVPQSREDAAYQASKGIFLRAYQKQLLSIRKTERSVLDIPAEMRTRILGVISSSFPSDTASFARALLLGDASGLDYVTDTALKISGIRHIVAVSGLHVSILFGLISVLCVHNRFLTTVFAIPSLMLFAAMAGFSPSVSRACIMMGLVLLSLILNKEYDGATALSFAAVVLLLCNPLASLSASFQLSIASVSGIFLFSGKIYQRISAPFGSLKGKKLKTRFVKWFCGSIAVSLGSSVFTIPLCAWYFGVVSLIGILTNLLTLWAVTVSFCGTIIVCNLYFLLPAAGTFLGVFVAYPIRYTLFVSKLFSSFPIAAVYTRSPYILAWLFFSYLVFSVLCLSKGKSARIAVCCEAMTLCLSLLISWAEPMVDDVRCTVLDVGQGQCILLQSGGRNYMVDCGGDGEEATANIAAQELLSQGVSRLDGLILTHFDQDHVGAVPHLLSRVETDVLVLPSEAPDATFYCAQSPVVAQSDIVFEDGNNRLFVFVPDYSETENESSLCVLFDTEKCDILITGDQTRRGEQRLLASHSIPKVDVLIAGHHGSDSSTGEDLLDAVSPDIVCISVGKNNAYGHPSAQTMQRLEQYGCTVYRTDKNGTITIRR